MHSNRISKAALVAVVGVAALGSVGVSEASTEPPLSGQLNIGVPIDLTGGSVGEVGQRELEGIQLAVAEATETGFLGDVEINLIVEDTQSQQDQGPIAVSKLIEQDDVSGIVGFSFTALALASAPIAEEAGVPTVAVGVSDPRITEIGDHIFRTFPVYARLIVSDGPRLLEQVSGTTAALVLQSDSEASIAQYDAWKDVLEQEGYELVADVQVASTDTDYAAQATVVSEASPDVVIQTVAAGLEGQVVNQLRQAGFSSRIIGGLSHGNADVQELMGENGYGNLWIDPYFVGSDIGRNPDFVALYEAEHDRLPDLFNAVGYDAMWLFLGAVADAGSFDRAAITDALLATTTFSGAQGECEINDTGDVQCVPNILTIDDTGAVVRVED